MRTLMLSTALVLPLMMVPALGQDTTAPAPAAPGTEATETMDTPMGAETAPAVDPADEAAAEAMTEEAVAASGKVEQQQAENELRIDWITDATVMSPEGTAIGDINDVIVDVDAGAIKAAVIGVGGFLGIGEKQIAVPWDQLSFDHDAQRITSDLTRDEAEAAPEYVFRAQADAPAATDDAPAATTAAPDTMATTPATTPDPATDPAAATVVTPDAAAASGEAGTTGAPSPADTADVPATEPEAGTEAGTEAAPADGTATPAPAN